MIDPFTGAAVAPARSRSPSTALATGVGVGLLGGLIGLGGAEFRLPLLIGLFGFAALQAVIMNKAMSLLVVVTALPARLLAVPFDTVNGYWFVVVNLLAGSLVGAWIGATWATRMRSATLYRVLAVLLVLIAVALVWNHFGNINPVLGAVRRPSRKVGQRKNRIPNMINIAERPAEADDRAVPGHWEGDLIIGRKNLSAIGTLVERTTNYPMLLHLPDGYTPELVRDELAAKIKTLPEVLRAR